jgi:hypothetical protein
MLFYGHKTCFLITIYILLCIENYVKENIPKIYKNLLFKISIINIKPLLIEGSSWIHILLKKKIDSHLACTCSDSYTWRLDTLCCLLFQICLLFGIILAWLSISVFLWHRPRSRDVQFCFTIFICKLCWCYTYSLKDLNHPCRLLKKSFRSTITSFKLTEFVWLCSEQYLRLGNGRHG